MTDQYRADLRALGVDLAQERLNTGPGLERWVPEVPGVRDGDGAERLPEPVRLLDVDDPPARWLADRFLLEGEPAVIGGDPAAGKSTLALAIGGAVAGGYPVLGVHPCRHPHGRPVLYVSEEDPAGILRNRLEALARGHGWDFSKVGNNLRALALTGARLDDLQWKLHLLRVVAAGEYALVIFDPLADLLSGNENSPSEARPVVQLWRALAARGVSCLTAAHLSKPSEHRNGQHRVRGAGTWAAAARSLYLLERRDGGIWLTCEKQSRMARPEPVELSLAVEADPRNPAVWQSARLEAASGPGDWRLPTVPRLTPSARRALAALERHQDEDLSWSKWGEVSGVGHSALSEARARLLDAGYVRKIETGQKRGGRPVWAYRITLDGRNAVIPETPTPRLRADSAPDSGAPELSDSATPLPPLGGAGTAEPELAGEGATRLRPELEPLGDAWEPEAGVTQ